MDTDTFKQSDFDVEYEANGVKICTPVSQRDEERKMHFMIFTDTGIASKTIGMYVDREQLQKLVDSNFSKEEIRNSMLLGEDTRFNVINDLDLEQQSSRRM